VKLSTIHLEHALPALADLGLDGLVPILMSGGKLEASALAGALQGLAAGAEKHAARQLVAVARATGEELLAWEETPDAKARALKAAALSDFNEAKKAVADFFTSFGFSPDSIPGSSEQETEPPPSQNPPPVSAPTP
jgi:hypothetical protein